MVIAGWCSSKFVGLTKDDGKNVYFFYVKQQIPELAVFNHCRGHRRVLFLVNRKAQDYRIWEHV